MTTAAACADALPVTLAGFPAEATVKETEQQYVPVPDERMTEGKDGEMYCIRGGGWQLPKNSCRVSWRGKRLPDLKNSFGGFRLCLDAKYVKEEEAPEGEILMKGEE